MTITSDERRAWVALAKETPQTYLVGARAEMLCAAVVRLVKERDEIMSRKVFTELAKANQRIETLQAAIREAQNCPCNDGACQSLANAITADGKEATK